MHVLSPLPHETDLETPAVLRLLAPAHRYLAELKGASIALPNPGILIDTLALQEAKDSSEIENIVTTHDELYQAELFADDVSNPATKEVLRYARALAGGFRRLQREGQIREQDILQIARDVTASDAGFRKLPGTVLKNSLTGETVYEPPQDPARIRDLMTNLIAFMNDDGLAQSDPLVKMAVAHHQFESIHPFYDGNGRVGRILNILYLVSQELLHIPVLYLSRWFIRSREDYYRLLQATRDGEDWEAWLVYVLEGVAVTAQDTLRKVDAIRGLMLRTKHRMRSELPKVYSQDLLNNLFRHPYTKIAFVQRDLKVSRPTATKYLDLLAGHGFVVKSKRGRVNFYVNSDLLRIVVAETSRAAGDGGRP